MVLAPLIISIVMVVAFFLYERHIPAATAAVLVFTLWRRENQSLTLSTVLQVPGSYPTSPFFSGLR